MMARKIRLALCVVGLGLFARGAYMPAKAEVAQYLLGRAWIETAHSGVAHSPWPGLDAVPVARLSLPDGQSHIVLNKDSGQALAFGPGVISGTGFLSPSSAQSAPMIGIAAHKNTQFSSLKDIKIGDDVTLERPQTAPISYEVFATEIVDVRDGGLPQQGEGVLALVTCYPFDALSFNGPYRYVVFARMSFS